LNGLPIYLKLPAVVGPSKLALAVALAVAPAAAPSPGGADAVRAEIDRLVAAIGTARHLTYHGTLPLHVLDRPEAAREAERLNDQADADPASRADAELLRRLGLASPPRDEGDVPGASPRFDAVTGRLWVPSFVPVEAQQVALAHEVAHAAADQRFGFRRLMEIGPDGRSRLNGDARRARLALVEGDAMLTGLELLDPREGFLGAHELTSLAGRLRAAGRDPAGGWTATLAGFTHVDGLLFLARARAHHPWNAVDALWTDPPSSTEQILHPEKYESCEGPVTLEPAVLPALPGLGAPSTTDVAGELVVRTWLATAWSPEVAARAAAGWGGDRAALYGAPSGAAAPDAGAAPPALSWLTVWDDAGEAEDFARAARLVLQRMAEKESHDDASEADRPDGVVFSSSKGLFGLARRADAVALLIAAPEGSEPALEAMLGAIRRPGDVNRRPASRPRPAALPGCLRRDRAGGSE
jgi:hypothetical protein